MAEELEARVAGHYARGDLESAIVAALVASGKDPERLAPADLAGVDELHVGGRAATAEFAARLGLRPGMRVLDAGSGLGGPARALAAEQGCLVDGVDLTEEFVRVATSLSARTDLADRTAFRRASLLDLPFEAGRFDAAVMLHVGMNIAAKDAAFAEIHRVLRPGGVLGIYDIMREGEGDLAYPVPWASTAEASFLADAATYRRLLEAAGFEIVHERSRRDFALDYFRQLRERAAAGGAPPAPGPEIVMGPTARVKRANLTANVERGLIAPTEIVGRRR